MGNLFDYLDWRGDVPFSVDPFNEVDNLVLSEMAYVDFSGIVPEPAQGDMLLSNNNSLISMLPSVSVSEVCDRFWQLHTEEEVKKSGTLYRRAPMILKKLCSGARFGNMRLAGYVNQISRERNEQMAAVTCFLGDGTAYVAFRGTDDTIVGWKEDFSFIFRDKTEGQRSAAEYLTKYFNVSDNIPLRVGGHSKGGNFSVFAAAFCPEAVRNRILEVYSNDGPGFLKEVTEQDGYRAILPRVKSILPEESVFGLLLENTPDPLVVQSTQKGIWQHDALSWVVLRNRFQMAPGGLAESSILLGKSLDAWIDGMSMEERKEFVDIVFSLLEGTGAENVSEITGDQFHSIHELIRAYRSMNVAEKDKLRQSIGRLITSGINSIGEGFFPKRI